MSKRGAEEYITKDHGSTPNRDNGNVPVKMATAAQLAKRKMATPKSRLNNSRPAQPSSISSNPFNQTSEPQQQPLFVGANGASAFGASQSFPTPNPAPTGGFNFQPPSSSFTFGSTPSTINPFATLNGDTNNHPSAEDTMMESPQKKPALGFGGFGQNGNQANGAGGFSFGQPAVQPPSSGGFQFGAVKSSEDSNNPAGGLFGGFSKPEASKQSNNVFGQNATSQPSFGGFTTSTAPSQTSAAPVFSFGQPASAPENKPDSTSNNPASVNGFTPNATSAPPQKPLFAFGQQQSSTPPTSAFAGFGAQKTEEPKQTSTFGQPANSQPFGGAFGKQATSESPRPSVSPSKSPEPTSGNPFSGLFGSAPQANISTNEQSSKEVAKTPVFNFGGPKPGVTQTSGTSAPSQSQPKAGLFGKTLDTPTTTNPAPTFSFGAKPSQSNNTQQGAASTETSKVNEQPDSITNAGSIASKPIFNFAAASQSTPAGGLFSSTKSTASDTPKPQSVFGKPPDGLPTISDSAEPRKSSQSSSLFGALTSSNAPKTSSSDTPKAPTWDGGSLFGTPSQSKPPASSLNEKSESSANTFSGFSSKTATASTPTPTPVAASANVDVLDRSREPTSSSDSNPKRIVYTKSPARIPNYLNGEGYKEYDNNHRLRSLNREFQSRIATLDPQVHDFENVIRHYVAARESIGASTGLYIRKVAGTKRKNDDGIDEERDIPPQYKRARPDHVSDSTMSNTISAPSKFVPTSTPSQTADTQPSTQSKYHQSSRSTELFKSLIPSSPAKSVSQPPTQGVANPFASMSSTPSASSNIFAAPKAQEQSKPQPSAPANHNTFIPSAASTTPVKSPPKKPTFEMPKPVTGGFASFGAVAAANAKKFEKELKEKRKAEDFDSDEDDEATFEQQYEEEQRKKKAKIESVAKTGFVPTFSGSNTSASSTPLFGFGSGSSTSSSTATASKPAFTGFSGFTPSVPTSAKTVNTGFTPSFGQSQAVQSPSSPQEDEGDSGDAEDEEENEDSEDQPGDEDDEDAENGEEEDEDEDSLPEDDVPSGSRTDDNNEDDDDENDIQITMENNRNKGKSLFERIEPPSSKQADKPAINGEKNDSQKPTTGFNFGSPIMDSAKNSTFKPGVFGSAIGKSTPEAPSFSPVTPTPTLGATKEPYKPATTFNFNPPPQNASNAPIEGASILAGGTGSLTPARFEGMFGSRPSTPSNVSASNIFGQASSTPAADHTWKPGSGIKFGTPDKAKDAPVLSITSPSPSREPTPFGGLFGKPAPNSKPEDSATHVGFNFGGPTSAPVPGYLGAAPHLAGGSGTTSGFSSRATSPGLTDNESVATNETDEAPSDPQTSLLDSRPGEENEEILWESRARAIKFFPSDSVEKGYEPNKWNVMGTGQLRILKDKTSGKVRAILRTDPGASIIINQYLVPSLTYNAVTQTSGSGATSFPIVEDGKIRRWTLKVKTAEMADKLSELLEKEKTSGTA